MPRKINVRGHKRKLKNRTVSVRPYQRTLGTAQRINLQKLNAKIRRIGGTDKFPFNKNKVVSSHLPIETAVVIPSTKNGTTPISKTQFNKRIKESELELAKMFEGYTKVETVGGYTNKDGKLVNEAGVKITVFTKPELLIKKKVAFRNWLLEKQEQWTQDDLAFEIEGDLYFIRNKEKPKKKK